MIAEKIFDQAVDSLNPIFTIWRTLAFAVLITAQSPASELFLSGDLLHSTLAKAISHLTSSYADVQFQAFMLSATWAFLVVPFFVSISFRYLIRRWHIDHANELVKKITERYSKSPGQFSPEELEELHRRRLSGISRIKLTAGLIEAGVILGGYGIVVLLRTGLPWVMTLFIVMIILAVFLGAVWFASQYALITHIRRVIPLTVVSHNSRSKESTDPSGTQ